MNKMENINIFNKLIEKGIPMGRMVSFIGKSEKPNEDMKKLLCIKLVSNNECLLSEIVKEIKHKNLQ